MQELRTRSRPGLLQGTVFGSSLLTAGVLVAGPAAAQEATCTVGGDPVTCVTDISGIVAADATGANADGSGGAATIATVGSPALGIYALSGGADGADGEEASLFDESSSGGGGAAAGSATATNPLGSTVSIPSGLTVSALGAQANGGNGGSGGDGSFPNGGSDGGDGGAGGTASGTNAGVLSSQAASNAGLLVQANGGDGGQPGQASYDSDDAGTGGAGGAGGTATATNQAGASITTGGVDSPAIFAQANGGDGASVNGTLYVYSGAGARGGGDAGMVTVTNSGTLTTTGTSSAGIWAETIGGNPGGTGSTTLPASGAGGTVTITSGGTITTGGDVSHGIGGTSQAAADPADIGPGAAGGAVTVTTLADLMVQTSGANSDGIYASSVGGPGGNTSGGGQGGAITLTVAGSLQTGGDSALGIEALSTGGSGGADGGIGPAGGAGGAAGPITVTLQEGAGLITAGADSPGLSAVTTGGAGGIGSDKDPGGAGGNAGTIGLSLGAGSSITTGGAASAGVYAVSTGGAGADGGISDDVNAEGGHGGAGGTAAVTVSDAQPFAVVVASQASITTTGDTSSAIYAESQGGAGGGGGGADGIFHTQGGNAGSAGAGGALQLQSSGPLTTGGNQSYGLFGLSIGGGGANGGDADGGSLIFSLGVGGGASGGGSGGTVDLTNSGAVTTTGDSGVGLFGESIGGGGGNGGTVSSGSASFGIPSVTVTIGGDGGNGGAGGMVTVTNDGSVTTGGFDAPAVQALSVGGGGGSGGSASSTAYSAGYKYLSAISVGVSIGASGGAGGAGGVVQVTNNGSLSTTEQQSFGIAALSVGGGGGLGGNATTQTYAYGAAVATVGVSVALGGSGGEGGAGGAVTVTNDGGVTTGGFAADAVYAASTGGGGGNGGIGRSSFSQNLPLSGIAGDIPLASGSKGVTVNVDTAVGGGGGSGNVGGGVSVTNSGTLTTSGIDAAGVLAQSIGGGGGKAAAGQTSGAGQLALTVAVGGNGGTGGDGGAVQVTNEAAGSIGTTADGAHGIEAQSIGGGGGKGGTTSADREGTSVSSAAKIAAKNLLKKLIASWRGKEFEGDFRPSLSYNVGVGGTGGAGGDGGSVQIENDGSVTTGGDLAFGLYGQSVGGGGGDGGAATVAGGAIVNSGAALGGSGGAAGDGGAVQVTNAGVVATKGESAFGLFGQSIGAGGGVAGGGHDASSLSIDLNYKLGGFRGDESGKSPQGAGGGVTVGTSGAVTTGGEEAHAVIGQSVGGGGGLVFLNQGDATSSTTEADPELADLQNQVMTLAQNDGIDLNQIASDYASAVASATGTLSLSLGGVTIDESDLGQGPNDGGAVEIDGGGTIKTTGANAFGILAQSIGAGGGFVTDGGGPAAAVSLGTGSLGGGIGDGGTVDIVLSAGSTVTTTGAGSVGIFAQSIGGGGGYTGALDISGMSYSAFLAGSSLASGSGGKVTVENASGGGTLSVSTTGSNAHGIFAQSLSYGGGAVGSSAGIVLPDASGNQARSGSGTPGADPGGVAISLTGSVSATGDGAAAIFAQSGVQGTSGAVIEGLGTISVDFTGTLKGGGGTGAALWLDGGTANRVDFTSAQVSGLSGTAIRSTLGSEAVTIDSASSVTGDLLLDSNAVGEANSLVNDGLFYPSTLVALGGSQSAALRSATTGPSYLGSGFAGWQSFGTFTNGGTLDPGGPGTVATVQLYGDMAQTAEGTLAVDVDLSRDGQVIAPGTSATAGYKAADYLQVYGNVVFAGTVAPTIVARPTAANDGSFQSVVLYGAGAVTLQDPTVRNTAVITYGALQPVSSSDTHNYKIVGTADFSTPASGVPNLAAIAQQLQSDWNSGQADAADPDYTAQLAYLANRPNDQSYRNALTSLEGGVHSVQVGSTVTKSSAFQDNLFSCPVFEPGTALLTEESCLYSRGIYTRLSHDDDHLASGYKETVHTLQLGGQKQVSDNWFVGGSFAVGHSNLNSDDGLAASQADIYQVGVVAKRRIGKGWMVGAAAHYAFSDAETQRTVSTGGGQQTAKASPNIHTVSGRLRGSYDIPLGQVYLRPRLDLEAIYVDTPGYSESGAGGLDLKFDSTHDWTFGATPAIEVGGRVPFEGGIARPFASAGVTRWTDSDMTLKTRFEGGGGQTFDTTYQLDETVGRVSAGLELVMDGGLELRGQYDGSFTSDSQSHSGTLRVGWRF